MKAWRAIGAYRLVSSVALVGALLPTFSGEAQAPTQPPGAPAIAGQNLLANNRVSAIKLTFPPGAREAIHAHPFDIVVIQLTPGEVDFVLGDQKSTGHIEAGRVTYIPAQAQHLAGNAGTTPFDLVVVALR